MAETSLYAHLLKEIEIEGQKYRYFDLAGLKDPRISNPF